jgi:hypothetical protein
VWVLEMVLVLGLGQARELVLGQVRELVPVQALVQARVLVLHSRPLLCRSTVPPP